LLHPTDKFKRLGLLAIAILPGVPHILAQATVPTASRTGSLQVGGYFSRTSSDYSPHTFYGYGGYATFDFSQHFGIEANIRQSNTTTNEKIYERTYEIGGRYVRRYNRFAPYGRVSYGRGVFNFPYNRANLAYNLIGLGGGVDYSLIPRINLRADYEWQKWLNFPGPNQNSLTPSNFSTGNGLNPQSLSIGVAYNFH